MASEGDSVSKPRLIRKSQQNIYDPIKILSFNGAIIFKHSPDLKKKWQTTHKYIKKLTENARKKSASLGMNYFFFLQN